MPKIIKVEHTFAMLL